MHASNYDLLGTKIGAHSPIILSVYQCYSQLLHGDFYNEIEDYLLSDKMTLANNLLVYTEGARVIGFCQFKVIRINLGGKQHHVASTTFGALKKYRDKINVFSFIFKNILAYRLAHPAACFYLLNVVFNPLVYSAFSKNVYCYPNIKSAANEKYDQLIKLSLKQLAYEDYENPVVTGKKESLRLSDDEARSIKKSNDIHVKNFFKITNGKGGGMIMFTPLSLRHIFQIGKVALKKYKKNLFSRLQRCA